MLSDLAGEGIEGERCGMLAFKRMGSDVHHVLLVTGQGTVICSSSVSGCVVETMLDGNWHQLGLNVPLIQTILDVAHGSYNETK